MAVMASLSDKIRLRYIKALKLIPALVEICDILHIYDNTREPFRIFKEILGILLPGNLLFAFHDRLA